MKPIRQEWSRQQEWKDPQITGRNRVMTHVPLGAYADQGSARGCDRTSSPFVLSLNGTWRFQLSHSPHDMPAGFLETGGRAREGQPIRVPGNWQLDPDVDDHPIYTNMPYPFDRLPPEPPEVNPTGWYHRGFQVPAQWRDRRIFLLFESCDSACQVWLNGRDIGYSQDSKLPHEFEITDAVRSGENDLAVMVPRYCDGFYLEDQDYWHLSGIQRDVLLYSKPSVHLGDFTVRTLFDASYRDAELWVRARLGDPGNPPEGYSVEARLYDEADDPVFDPLSAPVATQSPMYGDTSAESGSALFRIQVPEPRKWTAETPSLYTLVLTLRDPDGNDIDFESAKVGFRQVEIRDRQLLLNGRRMILRGVNRHEHHPEKGRALTREDMRREIVAMKRLNFNAVRTSHYPNHPVWYDLCDELGLYVVDEANLETHGVQALITKDPRWMNAFMERGQRMVLRDKNHPSVILWSLGNESHHGPHHAGMHGWIKAYDPTRPVQYESGMPGRDVSDILCPMYPALDWVEEILRDRSEDRPMVLCEYAYAKGNANGNLHKFWELVDRLENFQGGFVWDWADKAFRREIDGRSEWAYGNEFDRGIGPDGFDYGSRENPQMCLNGVVGPDLTPWPGAFELMKVQAPVGFASGSDAGLRRGRITVHNKHLALGLDLLELCWELTEDGTVLQSGVLPFPRLAPGESGPLTLPLGDIPSPKVHADYWLTLEARMKEATAWCESGHRVAWHQFALPLRAAGTAAAPACGSAAGLAFEQRDVHTTCSCDDGTTFRFCHNTGALVSLVSRGRELLRGPLRHNFLRARTDNDYIIGTPGSYASEWTAAGLDRLRTELLFCGGSPLSPDRAVFQSLLRISAPDTGAAFLCDTLYTIHGAGTVEVETRVRVDPSLPCLPRIGVQVPLHADLETLRWYGRGPHENYIDRKHSACMGRYTSTVDQQFVPYIDPCECGGHQDTRWLTLTDSSGNGLAVHGLPAFHFSALHYRIPDLIAARHVYELRRTDEIQLCIDGFHMGVGGDTGWTRNVHPEYLLPPGTYRFGFRLERLSTDP